MWTTTVRRILKATTKYGCFPKKRKKKTACRVISGSRCGRNTPRIQKLCCDVLWNRNEPFLPEAFWLNDRTVEQTGKTVPKKDHEQRWNKPYENINPLLYLVFKKNEAFLWNNFLFLSKQTLLSGKIISEKRHREPETPDVMFAEAVGFVSHVRLGKSS